MPSSKKQEIKARRRRQQRQQRLLIILGVVLVALAIVGLAVYPSLQPVGDIVEPEPKDHPMADGMAMGNPEAKVRIDIYEDFQCVACLYFAQNIEQPFVENYVATGKVYYVFHNYPFIDQNSALKESQMAARAAVCAADQNRFWDYHDILFSNHKGENVGSFIKNRLFAFAEAIGLDMDTFKSCYDGNTPDPKIQADITQAKQLGVTGTPSLFINGVQLSPGSVPTYEQLSQAIDAELAGGT